MGIETQRCCRCRKVLEADEVYYYGGSCEACEGDWMVILSEERCWRKWIRFAGFCLRLMVGSFGLLADSWRKY